MRMRSPATRRIDLPTFILHWSVVASFLVSLGTGLRIASDYLQSIAGIPARHLQILLPEGPVIEWHVYSGWTLSTLALIYTIYLWQSGLTRRVSLDRKELRILRNDRDQLARSGQYAGTKAGYWLAVNKVIFHLAYVLVLIMILTGWMLYTGVLMKLTPRTVQTIHGVTVWCLVAYVFLHVWSVLKVGNFMKMFCPRVTYVHAAVIALVTGSVILLFAYLADNSADDVLRIKKVAEVASLTAVVADTFWEQADTVDIRTARGANNPGEGIPVRASAIHDSRYVYFRFRWRDFQRSLKYIPLIKRGETWQLLESGYDTNDENQYYEDKFAVIFSRQNALGSGTVHLGKNVIEGPHRDNPRGLHFTADGSIVDLWHWKSVRTQGMSPGYTDDNYIGPPELSSDAGARYTGGYQKDPSPPGPFYGLNWEKVQTGEVVPKWLPREKQTIEHLKQADLDPDANDTGRWFLEADESVPYTRERDDYPSGTVLPGIVIHGPLKGDRGDLRSEAEWKNGYWTLIIQRRMDTDSTYDVALLPGSTTYMWVGVFNHSQTRHSQHLQPVRVIVE